jgi:hypothetical protein
MTRLMNSYFSVVDRALWKTLDGGSPYRFNSGFDISLDFASSDSGADEVATPGASRDRCQQIVDFSNRERRSISQERRLGHKFHAICCGRTQGLYFSGVDCSKQVNRYKGAVQKSFRTLVEAEEYISVPQGGFLSWIAVH